MLPTSFRVERHKTEYICLLYVITRTLVRVYRDEVVQNKAIQKKTVVLVSIANFKESVVPAKKNSTVLNQNVNSDSVIQPRPSHVPAVPGYIK